MNYGYKIKWLIKNKGLSQRDVAKGINVPEMTLSNWTRMEFPPLEGIVLVCNYLQEPLSRFFLDEDAFTVQEKELFEEFSRFSPDQQGLIISMLKGFK